MELVNLLRKPIPWNIGKIFSETLDHKEHHLQDKKTDMYEEEMYWNRCKDASKKKENKKKRKKKI